MIAALHRLRDDRRGTSLLEFAILIPVMMGGIMGLGDMLYQEYAQSILTGTVQKAGRDSAIQGGAQNTAAIDGAVIAMMANMIQNPANNCSGTPAASGATWCSTRKSYSTFSNMKPENFTDKNGNGVYDRGECFDDVNGNKQWDSDPGSTGQGGANDITLYTMSFTYPRLFPVAGLFGWPTTQTISAKTILKNQPYASQNVTTVQTICT